MIWNVELGAKQSQETIDSFTSRSKLSICRDTICDAAITQFPFPPKRNASNEFKGGISNSVLKHYILKIFICIIVP